MRCTPGIRFVCGRCRRLASCFRIVVERDDVILIQDHICERCCCGSEDEAARIAVSLAVAAELEASYGASRDDRSRLVVTDVLYDERDDDAQSYEG